MKKINLLIIVFLGFIQFALAGGIVTNTNHSASWIRMPVRDASIDIDAVYYNPAGLTQLADGFYISVNNQTIRQKRKISNAFPYLKNSDFVGDVFVPALPTAFAAFKMGKFVISAGFAVVGGGGSADYKTGLPSFETGIAAIVPSLVAGKIPTTAYSADIKFNGSSAYFGFQGNISYKINDMISVSVGARYVTVKNTYEGYLKNILIDPNYPTFGAKYNGTLVPATDFFTDGAAYLNKASAGATAYSSGLTALATAAGSQPLTSAPTLSGGALTATDVATIQGLIVGAGQNATGITIAQAKTLLGAVAPGYKTKADAFAANALKTKDMEVETEQTGTGYAPIFGVNLNLLENKVNIGIKYEARAKMTITNATVVDGSGLFTDGVETPSDMPAMLSIGASYQILDNFKSYFGFHYYYDTEANYGKKLATGETPGNFEFINDNSMEFAGGFEVKMNEKLLLSAAYLYGSTSPALAYQTDLSYSLKSHTIGFGGKYAVSPRFDLELGILYTYYNEGEKGIKTDFGTFRETYYKDNMVGSIGLTYRLGGN